MIPAIEAHVGTTLKRIIADAGDKGHRAPETHRFRVYTGRQMRRSAAIEPVIGHLKDDDRMGRNHLAETSGDAANAVLAAVGYNFSRLLAWIGFCLQSS